MKYLRMLPIAAFPYVVLFFYIKNFKLKTIDVQIPQNDINIILGLFLVCVLACIVQFIKCKRAKYTSRDAAVSNLMVKLFHVPFYFVLYELGFSILYYLQEVPKAWIILAAFASIIVLSGTVAVGCPIGLYRENRINKVERILITLGGYILVVDAVLAVYLYAISGKKKKTISFNGYYIDQNNGVSYVDPKFRQDNNQN